MYYQVKLLSKMSSKQHGKYFSHKKNNGKQGNYEKKSKISQKFVEKVLSSLFWGNRCVILIDYPKKMKLNSVSK